MAKLRVDKIAAPIVQDEFTGSVYFDGNGDYLSIPTSTDFALGTNDWTVEWFAYPTSTTQYQRHFYLQGSSSSNIDGVFADSSGIAFGRTGVWASSAATNPLNQWNHYALVHDSTNMRLYINGIQVLTNSNDFGTDSTKTLNIGYSNSTFGGYFTGYISNFRVCKGHAVYTENFTVPTRELEVHLGAKGVVFPAADNRTVLLACQSSTDTTAEATGRHILTANGNATAADANPGLFRRTLNLTTVTETTGSVFFDGGDDGLRSNPYDELTLGTGALTIECWFWRQNITDTWQVLVADNLYQSAGGWSLYTNTDDIRFYVGGVGEVFTVSDCYSAQTWTHVAVQRDSSGNMSCYINGVEKGVTATNSTDYTDNRICIGANNYSSGFPAYVYSGYISNVRVCRGHNVYTSNFAPPTRELEVHPGPEDDRTILLACYDGENVFAEKTGKIIAANGDRLSSPTPTATDSPIGITTHNPGLTRNVDPTAGPTFQGGAGYTSQNWLTLPKGTTTERMPVLGGIDASNARGVFAGGYSTSNINYIQISTLGNSSDFGERFVANFARPVSVSSSTRGLFGGGFTSPSYTNVIDYITISSTGDGKDFGDMMNALWARAGCSNSVRGIIAGGSDGSNTNLIEHLTISTTGNTQDFGDLTRSRREMGGSSSTTRGIFMGGRSPVPSGVNNDEDIIDYITIASTGNAVDFGNLAAARTAGASCSNATRSLYSGGNSSNAIEFVTIATLGDAVDFGDMSNALNRLGSCASSTRGIIAGGSPTNNTIEYVTIATAGDAQEFGDLSQAGKRDIAGLSNGHGGLG